MKFIIPSWAEKLVPVPILARVQNGCDTEVSQQLQSVGNKLSGKRQAKKGLVKFKGSEKFEATVAESGPALFVAWVQDVEACRQSFGPFDISSVPEWAERWFDTLAKRIPGSP